MPSESADGSAKAEPRSGRPASAEAGGGTRPPKGSSSDDESPGVPGFRTWRGVYAYVFACIVQVVIALTILARYYA